MVAIQSTESLDVKDKSRIWYFPLATSKEKYLELFSQGVKKFVVDNEEDLASLLEIAPKGISLF